MNIFDKLALSYVQQPNTQKIVNFLKDMSLTIPAPFGQVIGGTFIATDFTLTSIGERIRHERYKVFLDEIANGDVFLSEEIIQKDDFIHCVLATLSAVAKTRRHEKIKFFARLLVNSFKQVKDVDEYENYLKILDELNYMEIEILLELYSLEQRYPIDFKDQTKRDENERNTELYFKELYQFAGRKGHDKDMLLLYIKRLERTGCYESNFLEWDEEHSVNEIITIRGRTTKIFSILKRLVEDSSFERQSD